MLSRRNTGVVSGLNATVAQDFDCSERWTSFIALAVTVADEDGNSTD